MPSNRLNILISNDDGFDAPGLVALHAAATFFGDVTVVAPATCHSSRGHAVECKNKIRIRPEVVSTIGTVHVVESTPADSVRAGLDVVCPTKPNLVIAGINPGANLGIDVYYSGTVAAVREAAIAGVPGIAVSRYMRPGEALNWDELSSLTQDILGRLIPIPLKPGEFWNVNLPATHRNNIRGLAFVPQSTEAQTWGYQRIGDNGNLQDYSFQGIYAERLANQAADVRYVFDNFVTATRLQLSTSAIDEVKVEAFPQSSGDSTA